MLARASRRALHSRHLLPAFQRPLPSIQAKLYATKPPPRKAYEYKPPTRPQSGRQERNGQVLGSVARAQAAANTQGDPTAGSTEPSELDEAGARPDQKAVDPDGERPLISGSSSSANSQAPEPAVDPAPTQPLPDLTQGIPSTLGAELASASAKADPESLNVTEAPTESSGRGGGDLPKSAYISSFERRRNRWANYFYAFTLLTATASTVLLGRNWETPEEERRHPDAPSGWGFRLFYNRVRARLAGTLDYYNEPAFEKLLPNTDPSWERPYTLVLSLEDLLVHSEWDREHGWRMAKRPGIDYFLRYLSQYYELVIFTSVPSMIGQPIISKLDPYHIVMWPLFREATRYRNGEYIKVSCS